MGQFLAQYFTNQWLADTPAVSQCETRIDHNTSVSSGWPGNGVGSSYFSARWTGQYSFGAGTYTFAATTDDGMRVWLDGNLIIDQWQDQPPTTYTATQAMTAGTHMIKVEYFQHAFEDVAKLQWRAGTASPVGQGEFGAVFALDTWTGGQWKQGFDERGIRSDLADMQLAGVTWASMYTFGEEHTDDIYLRATNLASEYGVQVLPVVDQNVSASRMEELVVLLKDRIHIWQIGNEVDLPQDANDQNSDPSRYIAQLSVISATIHHADPLAQVMIGGLCECDSKHASNEWLDAFVAAGGHRYIDLLGFHPYGVTFDIAVERLHMIQSQIAATPSLANMPLWLTEFGWQDGATSGCCKVVPERSRAQTMIALIKQFRSDGITAPMFIYVTHEPSQPPTGAFGFGLVNKNLSTMETTFSATYYAIRDWQASPENTTNRVIQRPHIQEPKLPRAQLVTFPEPVPVLPIRKRP